MRWALLLPPFGTFLGSYCKAHDIMHWMVLLVNRNAVIRRCGCFSIRHSQVLYGHQNHSFIEVTHVWFDACLLATIESAQAVYDTECMVEI